jgi:hypothetical protein
VKHAEGFRCAIRQIDAALEIHLGQERPTIFHNHSDTLAAKADVQDGAEGQSPVGRDELLVVVDLTIG